MRSPVLTALALLFALPAVAQAPRPDPAKSQWSRTDKGCIVSNPQAMPNGTATWSGACVNEYASGTGVFVWTWGERVTRYEGEMQEGRKNGRGVLIDHFGNRHDGTWRNDTRHGKGGFTWRNGNVYDGEWRDGVADGRGVYSPANGEPYSGTWTNGCFRDGKRIAAVSVPIERCR